MFLLGHHNFVPELENNRLCPGTPKNLPDFLVTCMAIPKLRSERQ
jgi:hypothetical protein